jgi:anti-sigma factor RsiW
MTRLTEEQLQQYLDGTLGLEERRRVEQILLVSPADREMLEEYRMLFGQLEDCSVHSLAPKFIPAIVAEAHTRRVPRLSRAAWLAGAGLASILVTFILSYFVELQPFWHSLSAYTQPVLLESKELWSSVIGLFGAHASLLVFLAAAGVILLAIQSLDRILLSSKYERHLR